MRLCSNPPGLEPHGDVRLRYIDPGGDQNYLCDAKVRSQSDAYLLSQKIICKMLKVPVNQGL